jgi:putative transposase
MDMRKHLWISKNLWNEMLEHTKQMYHYYRKFPTKKSLRQFTQKVGLYSQVGQELVDRLLDSIWRMVKLRKKGVDCGFPRFKSFSRMKSLQYPQSGFALDNKLKVTPFGEITIKQHRKIKGEIKTLTIKRESSGKWYAIFIVEEETTSPKKNNGGEVGLDLGLKSPVVLSDGTTIKNPRHLRKYEDKLAFLQRNMSRCKKRSSRWYKAKHKVSLLHEKVRNTRRDFLHKLSTSLVSQYSLISLENLAVKELAEKNYGKSIHDAGWSMFADMIRYKAEEAGCVVVTVDPAYTTQECSRCGIRSKKELWDRAHVCPSCGYSADRDLNAAEVILKRATAGLAGCNAHGLAATVA